MNRILLAIVLCLLAPFGLIYADTFVRGYTKKDGTRVRSHFRSSPGSKGGRRYYGGSSIGRGESYHFNPLLRKSPYFWTIGDTGFPPRNSYFFTSWTDYKLHHVQGSNTVVHRWVDSNGVTWFSDEGPRHHQGRGNRL